MTLRPRPVYSVREDANRSLTVADEVADGVFHHAGMRLRLGVRPDWTSAALPADEEWRIEWVKFYFGLDLAHAYVVRGHGRYLDTWVSLVESWIDQVPAGFDSSDVVGRRIQNWIYAWLRFAESPAFPELPDETARAILASLDAQLRWLAANLTRERNHRTLELYALLIGALAFPQLDPEGARRDFALAELDVNLRRDILDDGVHRERSTHYHMIAVGSFLGAIENAARFGLPLPDGFADRVELAMEYAMHVHRPDGEIPMLSDSDGGSYTGMLAHAAALFGRDDMRWVATGGRSGRPPSRRSVAFTRGGYHVQRSDWGDRGRRFGDARYLVFDCGPVGDGGHGHYDALSIEAYAYGQVLCADPGRFTYHEGDVNWRHHFKGTKAHNTVCVDGRDQTPYRRGKLKRNGARATLLGRYRAPGLDVVSGQVASACYDAVHTRTVALVDGRYWVLHDDLAARTPHHYDLRFHLPARQAIESVERVGARSWRVETEAMTLVIDGAQQVDVEDGWHAPTYGVKHQAVVVTAVHAGTECARFATILYPREPGAAVTQASVAWQEDGVGAITIGQERWFGQWAETVVVGSGHADLAEDGVRLHARATVTRRDHEGTLQGVAAVDAVVTGEPPESGGGRRRLPRARVPWITWERQTGWRWALTARRRDAVGV